MERQYVAIDLHRLRSLIVREDGGGQELGVVRIDNDPVALAAAVAEVGAEPQVAIEATYGWYWAVDVLEELGAEVRLVNPSGLAWGDRRVKNDRWRSQSCRIGPEPPIAGSVACLRPRDSRAGSGASSARVRRTGTRRSIGRVTSRRTGAVLGRFVATSATDRVPTHLADVSRPCGTLPRVREAVTAPECVEVLLFDLGGVVIDFDFGRCLARWAHNAGRQLHDIESRFSFDAAYEDHERGLLDAAEYFSSLRRGLAVELSDEELLDGWLDVYLGFIPDMGPLLAAASARFPLYAFTNTNRSHQAVWSERFAKELDVFTAIFVSSDLGLRKPDREAFEAVSATIEVPPSRILFFDDSHENVVGALEAGLQAVHVASTDSVRSALSALGVEAAPASPPLE